FATVNFTVLPTAPAGLTQVKFDFDPNNKLKTTDSNVIDKSTAADVLNNVTDGSFTVGSGSCAAQVAPQGGVEASNPSAGQGATTLPSSGDNQPIMIVILISGLLIFGGL